MNRKDGTEKTYVKGEKTKRLIAESFLSILDGNALDNITVQDICDKAEIHRTTFYKHFNSVFDLVNYLISYIIVNVTDIFKTEDGIDNAPSYIAKFLKTNSKALRNLSKTKYKEILTKEISMAIEEYLTEMLKKKNPPHFNELKPEWFIRYNTAGIMALAGIWVEDSIDENECKKCLEFMINHIFIVCNDENKNLQ